ncbi:Holliday junction resolvase RuvX [Pantoea sp. 18069]|uniref:Holliday junction resolvase RuvX n=1 Tax=Pantoea sp. 18069 TaxID=2681415 RepID=UPI001356B347|nr:Holliday junction resolvase RuvX [Pantoea sp. 18069]
MSDAPDTVPPAPSPARAPTDAPLRAPTDAPLRAPVVVPAHFQSFLAFDFGTKRTGVATGSRMLGLTTPQATIKAEGADARMLQVAARIKEFQPDALVIGVPYHPDGAAHENTARALKFGRQLRGRFGLQVFEVDERYSTTEALSGGARDADAASACIILEQFLRSLP